MPIVAENSSLAGSTDITGAVPFPDKFTDGFDAALVCMPRTAVLVPVVVGENVTATAQDAFDARTMPQVLVQEKAASFSVINVTFEIVKATGPELVTVRLCSELLVPTTPSPNWRLLADTAYDADGGGTAAELDPPPQEDRAQARQMTAINLSVRVSVAGPHMVRAALQRWSGASHQRSRKIKRSEYAAGLLQ